MRLLIQCHPSIPFRTLRSVVPHEIADSCREKPCAYAEQFAGPDLHTREGKQYRAYEKQYRAYEKCVAGDNGGGTNGMFSRARAPG